MSVEPKVHHLIYRNQRGSTFRPSYISCWFHYRKCTHTFSSPLTLYYVELINIRIKHLRRINSNLFLYYLWNLMKLQISSSSTLLLINAIDSQNESFNIKKKYSKFFNMVDWNLVKNAFKFSFWSAQSNDVKIFVVK